MKTDREHTVAGWAGWTSWLGPVVGLLFVFGIFGVKVIVILERFRVRFSWRLSTGDRRDGPLAPHDPTSGPSHGAAAS